MTTATPLARIEPVRVPAPLPDRSGALGSAMLTRRQKAAIVVRFLLNEGAEIPLTQLPDPLQEALTTQMGAMRYVDRQTLADVVGEFASELEAMGLTFPRGVAGALTALDGRISPQTAARLRKEAGVRQFGDPWAQVANATNDQLAGLLESEGREVAAVMLSRLEVGRAAELLGLIPGPLARQIAFGMSRIDAVSPDAVDRIGLSLATQLHERPETAFDDGPVERVGAILNFSRAATRDDVLDGLQETDQAFADQVRKAIFTFVHIPERLAKVDVPKVIREVDQPVLLMALKYASDTDLGASAEYLLDNMSKRMAGALREEMAEMAKIPLKDGEDAMGSVIGAIRALEMRGELELIRTETDEDAG